MGRAFLYVEMSRVHMALTSWPGVALWLFSCHHGSQADCREAHFGARHCDLQQVVLPLLRPCEAGDLGSERGPQQNWHDGARRGERGPGDPGTWRA